MPKQTLLFCPPDEYFDRNYQKNNERSEIALVTIIWLEYQQNRSLFENSIKD